MNECIAQSIARQRMEETARNVRYAYRAAAAPPERRRFPRVTWSIVRFAPMTPAQWG